MELNEAADNLRNKLIEESDKMDDESGFELAECGPHEDDILVRCVKDSLIEAHIPQRYEGYRVRKSYYQTAYPA